MYKVSINPIIQSKTPLISHAQFPIHVKIYIDIYLFSYVFIYLFIYLFITDCTHSDAVALQSFVGPSQLFSVSGSYTQSVELLGPATVRRKAAAYSQNKQIQNTRTQTSMSWVGFEPTIPEFEREKTIHALDHSPTMIGQNYWQRPQINGKQR
jgi:hypothetical protein